MTHVSLFTGIGGIDVAAEWAGFKTIAQVEQNPYCIKVLERHWPDVPRWTDIREFPHVADTEGSNARQFKDGEGEPRREDSEGFGGRLRYESRRCGEGGGSTKGIHALTSVTLVSGGFPCQPFSQAGKRRGTDDDRFLWPEMLRVIREIEPRWVLAENVLGLLSLDGGVVFETVLSDLESAGYATLPVVCPAAGAGAPHQRQRVFIVAHGTGSRLEGQQWARHEGRGVGLANGGWWLTEPDVGRVAAGVPHRVDRLRALGNAVVPQQVYPILQAIAEVENE